ncbi:MAG: FAD-dependent oxidoreductase [Rhodoferax sp.]|uniref:FAD-dependent oxidoreductase n=1 Tax=Rhodoferax sp. TaxID=50421 RepID=UPI00262324A8|nr:FAD-dependent oxidoreductase [Rhodoferax sp.]MDD5333559.1 FAD-dependent oxidoreductase [Rhodoferax sp.]
MTPTLVSGSLPPDTPHVPVAVVGAGACGLTAALMLSDAGVDCVLLERDAAPSGSTALSSGFIPAAGTQVQQAQGIEDSPARFAADIQGKAHDTAATHLVAAYTEAIVPAVDALQSRHGIDFVVLDGFLYPGHSRLRMHAVPEKTGVGLMTRLQMAATRADLPVITDALVRQLWFDGGDPVHKVRGVSYQRPDGTLEHLSCDVLLLACNGFGGNAEMVRELLPEMRDATFAGHSGNDGSAIAWGKALGAQLADLGGYQGHGSWAVPQGALISWALMMEGGVQINAAGQRFHDETQGYSEASVKVLAQPGKLAWNVFDAPLLELAHSFPDFCEAQAAGAVRTCADAAALARLLGCDLEVLGKTLASISAGAVSADGRTFRRALQAPYYAVKVTGALFHTQGGLAIDARCRVLRDDGSALPNLLAAGGAARGVSGNAVWGYLSGNGLLSAVAGGYIAAQTASLILKATLPP